MINLLACSFDPSFIVCRTLLIHGLESDWIEEEMADDDDFRFNSKLKLLFFYLVLAEKTCWNRN